MPFSGRQPSHLSTKMYVELHSVLISQPVLATMSSSLTSHARLKGRILLFSDAYSSKTTKYESLIPLYQAQGLSATIVPFIVGALGSWCPWNDKFRMLHF
ncbi:hypothetical protein CEXT_488571 [Caerostris extrusa]|uniref:Uncharacterized protein n=1 Tax=Caerostris extrusa TaxID=172846 RepID=A0AAV4PP92_CAEEX|nr:hypothetical protein CEXT_488571 [Caerostris extrusa]